MRSERWVEVSTSQFGHEAEGLHLVKELLPGAEPFRAWSNFEFRDSHGRWHEVDLLVLGRGRRAWRSERWPNGWATASMLAWSYASR